MALKGTEYEEQKPEKKFPFNSVIFFLFSSAKCVLKESEPDKRFLNSEYNSKQ